MKALSENEIISLTKSKTLLPWSAQENANPIIVDKAKGVYFWDVKGQKFMDFNSQAMCVNIGHGDERITTAILKQLEKCAFVWGKEFTTEARAQLGKLLLNILPENLAKVFLVNSGTEANEHAIRIARNYSNKHKIIARYKSYHGATYGSISLTGDPRRWSAEPTMPGVIHVMDPYKYRCRWCRQESKCTLDCLNHIEDVIKYEGAHTIAAIIIEPVTGMNGIIIPPDGYLKGLRLLCDKYNILMIVDEVMTGFGRTGKWFAVDHWNVLPDIITMAKGLTSGYFPLSAVAVSSKIADYYNHNTLNSGNTYNAHPIGCAVAVACINIYESDNLINNAAELGIILSRELNKIKSKHISVGDVRSIGLFGAIEFVKDKDKNEMLVPLNANIEELKPMLALKNHLLEKGLFVNTNWNILLIIPPLCISQSQLLSGLKLIDEAIKIIDEYITQQ